MKDAYDFLESEVKDNDVIIAAISGGPDSMALLDVLLKLKKEVKIICAHVNHKVRKESDKEQEFVKNYCKKKNIIFETTSFIYEKEFKEDIARSMRYEYFEILKDKYHAKYVITAHHADDLIESILLRIIRGSTLSGYFGFSYKSKREGYYLLRPLLKETKESILTYLKENDIPYVIDKSNFDIVHTRNRIRKNILPLLKSENKNIHLKFLKYSNTIKEAEDYIKRETKKKYEEILSMDKIKVEELEKQDSYIQKRIIMYYLELIYKDNLNKIEDIHLNQILEMIKKKTKKMELPNFMISYIEDNLFWIESVKDKSYYIKLDKNVVLPNEKKIEFTNEKIKSNNYICLNKRDIKEPLYLRTRKQGDKIKVKNLSGTKKVNDIFIDAKIGTSKKDEWPILVDSEDKILWIPGLKKSIFDIEIENNCDIILKYH